MIEKFWIDDRDNGDGFVVHTKLPTHVQGEIIPVVRESLYEEIKGMFVHVSKETDRLAEENKRLKNQRDWLFAILLGTVMALTFVIHVITLDMPK